MPMKIHRNITRFSLRRPVLTLGAFDGLHAGHRQVIETLCKTAQQLDGESVVLTFWPHPRLVVRPNEKTELLNTLDEKITLFQTFNIDHLIIFPFTKQFSNLSFNEFITKILVNQLCIQHLVVGYDSHFGRNREGGIRALKNLSKKLDFDITRVDKLTNKNENVSSTAIRQALASGDILATTRLLGYEYLLSGMVVKGKQIGRTIGFPTANIKLQNDYKLIPANGVYAVSVYVDGVLHYGMLNIGTRPTVDNEPNRSIEVHLIAFRGELYGKIISVFFRTKIRNEKKFDSLEKLKAQIAMDKQNVNTIFREN